MRVAFLLPAQLLAIAAAALSAGCGGLNEAAQRTKMANNLKLLHLTYLNFHDVNSVGPSGWDELLQYAAQNGDQQAVQDARSAGYEVVWGVKMSSVKIGSSNFVLAHRPADETSGGQVVMLDGAIRQMTA